ncbi:uncharacterized protein LOC104846626 [Loxodonta africana]|uniref:uncharacterized protein LOC104846626 n=1 Tax=Loxodonta africana TaxID=9785 RepID=UPI000C813CA5|nr:uncharacterized protein LOC104846626 [Loxodonta africana]
MAPPRSANIAAARGLWGCEDPSRWVVLAHHGEVVWAHAGSQGRLEALDRWYHKELLVAGSGWSSGEKHVTRDELERLLTWKVAQLVAANPPELVVRCSAAAFRLLPDVLTAVTELCARRSVGAATASAVLAAGAPEAADFMSHEAVARVSGLPAQQYILQHYRLYLGQMQDHAKALSQGEGTSVGRRASRAPVGVSRGQGWLAFMGPDSLCSFPASASGPRTRQPAETALWTWAVGRKMCPGLLPDLSPGTVNIHVIRPAKRRRTQAD